MDTNEREPNRHVDVLLPIALIAIAVALRAWHIAWGLPDFTEEAIPLERSFAMRSLATGAIDWNPHAFNYPSLGIYLHLLVQQVVLFAGKLAHLWSNAADYQIAFYLNPTPMVLASRGLGVVCDAASVLAAYRIGLRCSRTSAVLAALLVGFSVTAISTARSIYVDSIMTALALWAIECMVAWHGSGGRGRLVAASVLVGLAAGTKYPAAALLLPLGALVVAREGRRGLRSLVLASGIAVLAFLVTTPYALFDGREFIRDFGFEGQHAATGHFGSSAHMSFGFHLGNLVRDLGWPAVLALAASPIIAWRKRDARALALALAVLAFGVPISIARIDAERYLLPVVAAAAPLVAFAVMELLEAGPVRLRAPVSVAGLLLIAATPVVAGVLVARKGARDTQVEARMWCQSHIPADQLVVTEGYGPRIPDQGTITDLRKTPAYALASAAWRDRVDRLPSKHVVALPLAVAGPLTSTVTIDGQRSVTLEVAPHAEAINNVYYLPALFAGVDWFISTSAVRGRFSADSSRFASPIQLYRILDGAATVAARFTPDALSSGPEIVIYRLEDRAHQALARHGIFDPFWWTAVIPAEYRARLSRLLAPEPSSGPSTPAAHLATETTTGRGGVPAPWVRSLQPLYQAHVATFAAKMAYALATLGRYERVADFAGANHAMMPNDVESCLLSSAALARTRRWPEARVTIEQTLEALGGQCGDPALQLQYARALAHTGEPARAAALTRQLVNRLPAGDPVAAAAEDDLSHLH